MTRELLDTPDAGPAAVRGGAIRVIGYGAGVLLTVGSAAVLFRHLGVADSGRYVTVLALMSIVIGVTDIGLTTIGVRELAVRRQSEQRRLMRDLLGLRLTLSVLGVAIATLFAVVAGYDHEMIVGGIFAGVGVVAASVQATLGIALMVELRYGWLTLLDILRQALLVAGILILVAADAGIVPLLALQAPSVLIVLFLTAWLVRGSVPLLPAFEYGRWRALLREVIPFAAATIVAAVYFRASLITLGLVSTDAETGYFGAAFRVSEVLLLVPGLLVGAAFPIFARAARDDHDRLQYGVDRVFRASVVLGGLVMVALVLGAQFVIDVVAGPDFGPSAGVLRIQAAALFLSFAATTLFYGMLSLRMHRGILAIASTVLAVNVALAAILGASHGATGAAWATVVSELAGLVVALALVARSHRQIVPRLVVVVQVLAAAGAALLIALVPGLPSVADAVIGAGIYAALALALRVVPPELLEAFARRR